MSDLSKWLEELNSEDAVDRTFAVLELGELKEIAALEALAAPLRDTDAEVRETAAGTIADSPLLEGASEALILALIGVIERGEPKPKACAARALRDIGKRVLAFLSEAIEKSGDPSAKARLLDVVSRVEKKGKKPTFPLKVVKGNLPERKKPKRAIETDAVGDAIAALQERKWNLRVQAAKALGGKSSRKDPRTVDALTTAVTDKNAYVRRAAAESLGRTGQVAALDALFGALRDEKSMVRLEAAQALGRVGSRRANGPLIEALEDPHSGVVNYAAIALGRLADPAAIEPLAKHLKGGTGRYAKDALVRIGPPAVERVVAILEDAETEWREKRYALEVVEQLGGEREIPVLERLLKDKNAWVRRDTVPVLQRLQKDQASSHLIARLRDDDAGVRRTAASAVGSLRDGRSLEGLLVALRRHPKEVARGAFHWLIALGLAGTERYLIEVMNDSESPEYAVALARCGNDALETAAREWFRIWGSSPSSRLSGPKWGESWSEIARDAFERAKASDSATS